jgi:hypothetical protein
MNIEKLLSIIFSPIILLCFLVKKIEYSIKNKIELKKDNHHIKLFNQNIDKYYNKINYLANDDCYFILEQRLCWIITKKESVFLAIDSTNELSIIKSFPSNQIKFENLKGKKYHLTYEIVRCHYIYPEEDYHDWPDMTYEQMLAKRYYFEKAFNKLIKTHQAINEIKVYKKTPEIEAVFKKLLNITKF